MRLKSKHGFLRCFGILTLGSLLVLGVGCTPNNQSQTRIEISLPDFAELSRASSARSGSQDAQVMNGDAPVGAMSAESSFNTTPRAQRIMINVTGPGIASPIVWIWERKAESDRTPTSIDLAVPRGPDRLVQLLVVVGTPVNNRSAAWTCSGGSGELGDGDSAMQLFYAQDRRALSRDAESVVLQLASLNAVGSTEGRVSGRYISADGAGPSGEVSILLDPGQGRSPMVVERDEIIGGWFDLFAYEGVKFDYRVGDLSLFGGAKDLVEIEAGLKAANVPLDQAVGFHIPERWMTVTGWNSTTQMIENCGGIKRPRRRILVGYFGPGAGAQSVCHPGQSSSIPLGRTSPPALVNGQILPQGSNLNWHPPVSSTPPAVGSSQGPSAGAVVGAYESARPFRPDAANRCQGGLLQDDEFRANLSLDGFVLGHEEMGFRGAFRLLEKPGQNGRSSLVTSISQEGSQARLRVEFDPLPGAESALSGYEIFAREGRHRNGTAVASENDSSQDGPGEFEDLLKDPDFSLCEALSSRGFVSTETRPANAARDAATGRVSFERLVNRLHLANDRVQVVVCPFREQGGRRIYSKKPAECGVGRACADSDEAAMELGVNQRSFQLSEVVAPGSILKIRPLGATADIPSGGPLYPLRQNACVPLLIWTVQVGDSNPRPIGPGRRLLVSHGGAANTVFYRDESCTGNSLPSAPEGAPAHSFEIPSPEPFEVVYIKTARSDEQSLTISARWLETDLGKAQTYLQRMGSAPDVGTYVAQVVLPAAQLKRWSCQPAFVKLGYARGVGSPLPAFESYQGVAGAATTPSLGGLQQTLSLSAPSGPLKYYTSKDCLGTQITSGDLATFEGSKTSHKLYVRFESEISDSTYLLQGAFGSTVSGWSLQPLTASTVAAGGALDGSGYSPQVALEPGSGASPPNAIELRLGDSIRPYNTFPRGACVGVWARLLGPPPAGQSVPRERALPTDWAARVEPALGVRLFLDAGCTTSVASTSFVSEVDSRIRFWAIVDRPGAQMIAMKTQIVDNTSGLPIERHLGWQAATVRTRISQPGSTFAFATGTNEASVDSLNVESGGGSNSFNLKLQDAFGVVNDVCPAGHYGPPLASLRFQWRTADNPSVPLANPGLQVNAYCSGQADGRLSVYVNTNQSALPLGSTRKLRIYLNGSAITKNGSGSSSASPVEIPVTVISGGV